VRGACRRRCLCRLARPPQEPAVTGAVGVVQSVARVGGVRRIVFTSSSSAITDEPEPGHVRSRRRAPAARRRPRGSPLTPPRVAAWG
jgi:hypothetical protein